MISNLAFVHKNAKIGENVTVEPFSYISGNVVIGDNTWVGPGAKVLDGSRIGKACRIFPGAVVSGIPQDLKFRGEESIAEVGDNTTIRECVTLNRGTASKGKTVIGSDTLLMAYVHIGHDCVIGNNCILGNGVQLAGEVRVDDWAIISGGAMAHQFTRIGGHVMVGGATRIRIDVPPFIKADREPLAFMGINSVGLSRRGFEKERMDEIHEIYRAIYLSGRNTGKALEYVENNFKPSPDRDYILEFFKKTERGVIRGPRER